MKFTISRGFSEDERQQIAALYWEAFAAKLHVVLGPPAKARAFIAAHLNPGFALVARGPAGDVLGVAGFKTAQGALIGGGLRDMAQVYGWLSTLWRGPILALLERDLASGVLLMDGICVTQKARGLGLGTALLRAIVDQARDQGQSQVRLDVIDTNPRARALYEREGFRATGQRYLGPMRHIFGFRASTSMLLTLDQTKSDVPRQQG